MDLIPEPISQNKTILNNDFIFLLKIVDCIKIYCEKT